MAFILKFKAFPEPDGPLAYAPVPWDSDLFGFPFYELNCGQTPPEVLDQHLAAWLANLPCEQPCLVLARLNPDQVATAAALARQGFYPVETMLDFELNLARLQIIVKHQATQYRFRNAIPADLSAVRAIALRAYATDRFHLDPHLPSAKADRRYAQWVENSFHAQEPIFVLEDTKQAQVVGFIQCRDKAPQVLDVCLGAVRPEIQNSGAGVLMYQQLFVEHRARGYQKALTYVSINNIRGIKLTLRYGFTVSKATLGLHYFRAGDRP